MIAPLWELEDRAGFVLSCHFYAGLLNGKSSAESLRFAKIEMLKTTDLAGCMHWAPLVLFGSGR